MKNHNLEEKALIKRVLGNEVSQVIAIIAAIWVFVSLVILPLQMTMQKVNEIENNHIVHLQKSIDELKDVQKGIIDVHIKIIESLGRIEGKLGVEK